jgi:hypothetical protein
MGSSQPSDCKCLRGYLTNNLGTVNATSAVAGSALSFALAPAGALVPPLAERPTVAVAGGRVALPEAELETVGLDDRGALAVAPPLADAPSGADGDDAPERDAVLAPLAVAPLLADAPSGADGDDAPEHDAVAALLAEARGDAAAEGLPLAEAPARIMLYFLYELPKPKFAC